MNAPNPREELLTQESFSPELKVRYEKEVQRMLERPLTTRQRIGWAFGVLLGFMFFVGFGTVAVWAPAEFPAWGRLIFGLGSIGGLVEIAFGVYILNRGKFNLLTHGNAVHGATWGFMVIMMVISLLAGSSMDDVARGTFLVLYGLVFFVMFAIPALIMQKTTQLDVNLREQILRLELQIAELNENLDRQRRED